MIMTLEDHSTPLYLDYACLCYLLEHIYLASTTEFNHIRYKDFVCMIAL